MILTRHNYTRQTFTSEDHFTAVTNMYISHNYAGLRGFYFHIPNESQANQHRRKGSGMTAGDMERIKQASKGVLPGVPDFCFMLPYVWYMELKMKEGRLSESQKSLHKRWLDKSIVIHVAWCAIDVCAIMEGVCGLPQYP